MIIYNVTIHIEDSVHDEWMIWMKTHIPQVLATGKFTEAKFTKVLTDDDRGGTSYSIQYRAKSREALQQYYSEDAERLRSDGANRFADKMIAFRTELEIIDEYTVSFN